MADHAVGIEIVTPEQSLFSGEGKALVAPTSEGDLTIMADHAEIIGDVVPGVVKIEPTDGDPISIVVHGGFLQVTTAPGAAAGLVEGVTEADRTTRATILAGVAELSTEIDVPRAESAKARAEARLAELRPQVGRPGEAEEARDAYIDLAEAEAALARAEMRLATASPIGMH